MKYIDIRSLLIGFLLCAVIVVGLAATRTTGGGWNLCISNDGKTAYRINTFTGETHVSISEVDVWRLKK